jgi:hypothetical protein
MYNKLQPFMIEHKKPEGAVCAIVGADGTTCVIVGQLKTVRKFF